MRTVERSCHCEPVVLRAANQNFNDCQWQSYLNVAHAGVAIRSPKPSPERRRWLEEPDEVAVKFLGSPVPCMSLRTSPQTGVALSKDSLRSQSVSFVPPWLPLRGSCHEVTERVNTPSPPLWGTSPIGRGKLPSSARCGGHLPRGGRQGETDCHVGLSAFSQ